MVAVKRNDAPIEVYGPQVPVYSQYAGQPQPMNYGQPQQHEQQTKGVQSPGPHDQQQYQQPQEQQYQQPQEQQYQQHPQQQFEHSQQYQQPQQYQQHEMQNMQPQQPSPAASPYAQK
jgi:S-DNA-T family DNA segregation ATPase FtsK/SpoIIIE